MRRRQAFNPLAHRCRCVAYFIITPEPPMGETTPSRSHVEQVHREEAHALALIAGASQLLRDASNILWGHEMRGKRVELLDSVADKLREVESILPPKHLRMASSEPKRPGLLFRIVPLRPDEEQTQEDAVKYGRGRRGEVVMLLEDGSERPATEEERAAYGMR